MKTSATCPNCGGAITFIDGAMASTPFRVTCGHCKSKLKVSMKEMWLSVAVVLAFLAFFIFCNLHLRRHYGRTVALVSVIPFLAAGLVLEAGHSLLVFNRATLTVVEKKKKKKPKKDL